MNQGVIDRIETMGAVVDLFVKMANSGYLVSQGNLESQGIEKWSGNLGNWSGKIFEMVTKI